MKRFLLLLLAAALAACGTDGYATTARGVLNHGTFSLIDLNGKIEAFPPAAGEAKNRYTVSASSKDASLRTYSRLVPATGVLEICPVACPPPEGTAAVNYLLRIPQGVRAELRTRNGDIDVSDVNAPVDARDTNGDIKIQIPSYADASTVRGNVSVTFGDANWPGTLHFATLQGDVELYVPALAHARVDLHTDRGTVFTDFNLHGTSSGTSETIVGNIGGGGSRTVVVRVGSGNIRLLKLVPQM